jgi:hypothetical protein
MKLTTLPAAPDAIPVAALCRPPRPALPTAFDGLADPVPLVGVPVPVPVLPV